MLAGRPWYWCTATPATHRVWDDAGLALADRDHVVRYDVHYTSIPGPCLEA